MNKKQRENPFSKMKHVNASLYKTSSDADKRLSSMFAKTAEIKSDAEGNEEDGDEQTICQVNKDR